MGRAACPDTVWIHCITLRVLISDNRKWNDKTSEMFQISIRIFKYQNKKYLARWCTFQLKIITSLPSLLFFIYKILNGRMEVKPKKNVRCLCWNLSIPVGLIWASRPTRWSLWYIRYMTEKYCTARLIWARLTFEGHLCRRGGWDLERGISRGGRLPLGAVWPTDFTKDPSKIEPRMQCRLSRTFFARLDYVLQS